MTMFNIVDNIFIETNDRISIFGRTGSGKTYFSKNWLLPHYTHYVFWDIKHQNLDVEHDIVVGTPKELKNALIMHSKILYQPKNPTDKDFNEICEVIFNNRNTSLYVDEAAIISTPSKILQWHNMIMTQGRTYGVGIINTSQRPRIVHNTLISESEHLFIFALSLDTDIFKIKQQMGDAAEDIRFLPEYHILYHNVKFNRSFIFKPVKLYDPTLEEIPKLELYHPSIEEYIKIVERHR